MLRTIALYIRANEQDICFGRGEPGKQLGPPGRDIGAQSIGHLKEQAHTLHGIKPNGERPSASVHALWAPSHVKFERLHFFALRRTHGQHIADHPREVHRHRQAIVEIAGIMIDLGEPNEVLEHIENVGPGILAAHGEDGSQDRQKMCACLTLHGRAICAAVA
jgi:hypothetical protein